ncbi:hypothetical protein [Ferrovibrio sp.]|uniref:hypothetical protein n=1 Tax=Ferrovibrio sp. TaxID=1917215 RepID=UPI0025B875AA|nr:hypothetical protein [Ferrovibrio sp.]
MKKPTKVKLGKSGLPLASHNPHIDFHNTEEAMFAVYQLGKISLVWNYCEHILGVLIWPHFGDYKKGMAVTANLGNQSRADLLMDLVNKFEENKAIIKKIEFATKAFNRLREIRNILMHSHSIEQRDNKMFEWRRTASKGPSGHTGSLASVADLVKIEHNILQLTSFLHEIHFYYLAVANNRNPPELPIEFEIPNKFPRAESG